MHKLQCTNLHDGLGNVPLCSKFHRLYNANTSFNITVAEVIGGCWDNVKIRRRLGDLAEQQLQYLCEDVVQSEERDKCLWTLTTCGEFTIRSMYLMIKALQVRCHFRKLWFIKVPLKIIVILWLMFKNSILLTKLLLKSLTGWNTGLVCRSVGGLIKVPNQICEL